MSSVVVYPKEMSLLNFLSEKAKKTWGKTVQNWWRGDFLHCLIVQCNPSMIADIQLLVLNFFLHIALKRRI